MAEASARGHFESSYEPEFDPPRDIDFIFYCSDTWKAVRRLARSARVVIDLGSGGGTLLYNVARSTAGTVAGVDFSLKAIKGASRLVPRAGFACGDLLNLPVRDRAADLVLSTMVIEHLDDEAFLKEAWRVLKPGGCLAITSVMRMLMRRGGISSLKGFTSSQTGNFLRKAARVPVPGYYSIEALCIKTA